MNAFSVDDSGPMQRLVRHVLGADEGARRHILRLSRQWWLLVVCGGLLAASATLGLESAGACLLTMSVGALAVGVGYVLLRSGWSRRCRDPSLAWPQLLASIVTVVLSYGLIDIARGAALQLLCLLLAFEMDRLSRRQLLTASLFAVSLLCLTALLRVRFGADPPDIPREVFDLVMAAVLLPVAIAVGGEVGRWRARLDEQRATLAATLSELERLSTSDALTGITNRRQMSLLLEQEEKRQRRGGAPFWIAIVDIDWFKQINDRYGHATGDAVLRDFAALCASQLDVDDVVARWGGEEFLLLLPATSEERALATLARIRAAVARHDWQAHAGGLAPGFSGGLAVHRADEALAHTLERADRALYAAKEAGRDRIWSAESARRIEGFVATARDAQGGRLAVTTAPMMRPVGTAEPTPVSPGVRPTSRWQRAVDLLMSRDPAIREALRLPVACYALQWMWMLVIVGHALPAGQRSRITRIHIGDAELTECHPPQSVSILLEHDLDISRGDTLVRAPDNATVASLPTVSREFDATIVWMGEQPLAPGREEYLDSEKYEIRRWDLERPDSLREVITLVNRIRREHPALQRNDTLQFHPTDNDQLIAYTKRDESGDVVLTVVNLDPHHTQSGWVDLQIQDLGIDPHEVFQVHDLLGGGHYLWSGYRNFVQLDPQAMPAHIFHVRRHVRTEQDFDYFM